MKSHWSLIAFLLFWSLEAAACPNCTYERMLQNNWYLKIWILTSVVPVVFSFNRLEAIRLLYVFPPYTWAYITLYNMLIWYGHPAVNDGLPGTLSNIGLVILNLGIPDIILLSILSRIAFFRRDKTKSLRWWQLAGFGVAVSFIRLKLLTT